MAKDYQISRPTGRCGRCGEELKPEQIIVATIREGEDSEFVRVDYCEPCWETMAADAQTDKTIFGVWRSVIPKPQEKKKLLADDAVIINFFHRLAETEDEVKIGFRYVLALILMRKKLLIYDGQGTNDAGQDIWKMHFKGDGETHEVIDPHMDEDRIVDVSQNLGQIMEIDE
jgi:hypothetical protein